MTAVIETCSGPPPAAAAAARLDGVTKRYGRRTALDDLSLHLPAGAVIGLVGSNGAGKTTTLSILAGLLRADAGRVDVLGRGPFHPALHGGRVSIMPQDAALPPNTPIAALLAFYAELQDMGRAEARRQAHAVLEWVHLADRAGAPVRTLSHGMRRRVVIAQAFLGDPDLVLLDEPTSGLDPVEVVNVRALIHRRRAGQTVVVSSHNLDEIERVCEHVIFIERGRLVRQDTTAAIVGAHEAMTYVLAGPPPDPAALRDALPFAEVTLDGGGELHVRAAAGAHAPADLNRLVLPWLLAAGADILEVRRGTRLERAYLRQRESPGAVDGARPDSYAGGR